VISFFFPQGSEVFFFSFRFDRLFFENVRRHFFPCLGSKLHHPESPSEGTLSGGVAIGLRFLSFRHNRSLAAPPLERFAGAGARHGPAS